MDVPAALRQCSARQQGLATTADLRSVAVTRSTLSRALARGEVVRVHRGVYAGSALPDWPRYVVGPEAADRGYVQHVRAALLALGEDATAAGLTAACLRGWGLLREPQRTVEVVVPMGRRRRQRLSHVRSLQRNRPRREALLVVPDQSPLWVTDAETTVVDGVRHLKLKEAVVLVDSALRSGQVTLDGLRDAARRLRGHRHAGRLRRALQLCDPESGSVLESALRVEMVEGGLVGFTTQQVARDAAGRYLLRVDFCFEEQRLVIEADGSRWHPDPQRDRVLDNRLVAAGWRVLRFTWSEVVHDPAGVLVLVRAALASGSNHVQLGLPGGLRAA
jgi:very-short-patch-repair endonuclease